MSRCVCVSITHSLTLRDTHRTHTGHAGAQGHTDHTDEPHDHPNSPTHTQPARQRDGRNRGRLNSRRPGADRSPRSTQKRPPPANPTLPPPAPRAPPRACSKAVGEIKARVADATGTSVVQEENTCRNPVQYVQLYCNHTTFWTRQLPHAPRCQHLHRHLSRRRPNHPQRRQRAHAPCLVHRVM